MTVPESANFCSYMHVAKFHPNVHVLDLHFKGEQFKSSSLISLYVSLNRHHGLYPLPRCQKGVVQAYPIIVARVRKHGNGLYPSSRYQGVSGWTYLCKLEAQLVGSVTLTQQKAHVKQTSLYTVPIEFNDVMQ